MRAPKFWGPGRGASLPACLLAPLTPAYSLSTQIHRGFVSPKRVNVPVICVGNLNAGGTGKTPTVIWLIDPDEPTDNEESSPREQEPDSGKDGAGLGQPI